MLRASSMNGKKLIPFRIGSAKDLRDSSGAMLPQNDIRVSS
jgi:hypothetical protein